MSRKPRGYWTKERVIRELRAQARELGHSPSSCEVSPKSLLITAVRLFGGWNRAKAEAGLKVYPRYRRGMGEKTEETFMRAFVRPMTATEIAHKLGWKMGKVEWYIRILKNKGLIRRAKFSIGGAGGGRGGQKYGMRELFGEMAPPCNATVFFNPNSLSHKVALLGIVKRAIPRRLPLGMRKALTHHLKRILPPDVFYEAQKLLVERTLRDDGGGG